MASTTATTSHLRFLHSVHAAPQHSRSSSLFLPPRKLFPLHSARAKAKQNPTSVQSNTSKQAPSKLQEQEVEVEVEEELPWIQDKALDLVEFTGTVTQAIPGPRVGQSPMPWLLAVPLAYVGLTFVIAVVKTVRKFTSPKAKRKKLVEKNIFLLDAIDNLFKRGREAVSNSALKGLMKKTGFSMDEILRKYIRYALNQNKFDLERVMNLIHLRKATMLADDDVAEILNEISRRIVKEHGPVFMDLDLSALTTKGRDKRVYVRGLFQKILYLAELPEFCTVDNSLIIKEIFGVTDEDAETIRYQTLSEYDDVESMMKKVSDSDSDTEEREDST
ncbi:ribosomal RNA small subunit methyltransferase J [Carex rostrata]